VINYFVYRINADYDGFTPSKIPERRSGRHIVFNWNAYFDALNKGDIVLAYFFGGGCKRGVYAVTRISKIRYSPGGKKVNGTIIDCSTNDKHPLLAESAASEFFAELFRTRLRGAEIVVPTSRERRLYELLSTNNRILERCARNNIVLPGSHGLSRYDITDVPRISLNGDLAPHLKVKGLVSAFWVKPRQATWIRNSPQWLDNISDAFGKFKGGDMTQIQQFADALEDQVRSAYEKPRERFALITGVPLSNAKLKAGEVDRVAELCIELSDRLGLRYEPLFSLRGEISRRSFKNLGYTTEEFIRDYKKNLMVKEGVLRRAAGSGKGLLLVDDVFTDGITTSTIQDICRNKIAGSKLEMKVATLALMTKKQNLAPRLMERFS
jgi:predicted amidophosphoribosyltransferase